MIQKAMKTWRTTQAKRPFNDAINTRNDPSFHEILLLPLQSQVCIWRQKSAWQGPYKIMAADRHNTTIEMTEGPFTFGSTVVKPCYRDYDYSLESSLPNNNAEDPITATASPSLLVARPKGFGKSPESKNKLKSTNLVFLKKKENSAYKLSLKLRVKGTISTSSPHLRNLILVKLAILLAEVSSNLKVVTPQDTLSIKYSSHVWCVK